MSNQVNRWAISSDGERFEYDDFATKEAAIAEGLAFYQGEPFYVGEVKAPTQPEEWFEAEDWLEHVSVQDEYSGDHAEYWDNSSKPERDELTAAVRKVMAEWLDRHKLRPAFFNIENPELIDPATTGNIR